MGGVEPVFLEVAAFRGYVNTFKQCKYSPRPFLAIISMPCNVLTPDTTDLSLLNNGWKTWAAKG